MPKSAKAQTVLTFVLCLVFGVVGLATVGYAAAEPLGLTSLGGKECVVVAAKPKAKTKAKPSAKPAPKLVASSLAVKLTEMKIELQKPEVPAGQVSFDILNAGAAPHELVVLKTDTPAADLGQGATVPEPGKVGESGDMAAAAKKTLKLKLAAGHYALICNIAGHYVAGMHADLTVK